MTTPPAPPTTGPGPDAVLHREGRLRRKIDRLPAPLRRLARELELLLALVRDWKRGTYRAVPWSTLLAAAAALTYFLVPLDAIPDFIPLTGLVDDAAMVGVTLRALRGDLERYCAHRGTTLDAYLRGENDAPVRKAG